MGVRVERGQRLDELFDAAFGGQTAVVQDDPLGGPEAEPLVESPDARRGSESRREQFMTTRGTTPKRSAMTSGVWLVDGHDPSRPMGPAALDRTEQPPRRPGQAGEVARFEVDVAGVVDDRRADDVGPGRVPPGCPCRPSRGRCRPRCRSGATPAPGPGRSARSGSGAPRHRSRVGPGQARPGRSPARGWRHPEARPSQRHPRGRRGGERAGVRSPVQGAPATAGPRPLTRGP